MYVCIIHVCMQGWMDGSMNGCMCIIMNVYILVYVCVHIRIIMKVCTRRCVHTCMNLHGIVLSYRNVCKVGWWGWDYNPQYGFEICASVYSIALLQVTGVGEELFKPITYNWIRKRLPQST